MLAKETIQKVSDYRHTAKLNRWFDCAQWPRVQAIRSSGRDVDPEQLRSEMGAGAADSPRWSPI